MEQVRAVRFLAPIAVVVLLQLHPAIALAVVGDCSGDGQLSVNELIVGVSIGLGDSPVSSCPAADQNADGAVTINELITAVGLLLNQTEIHTGEYEGFGDNSGGSGRTDFPVTNLSDNRPDEAIIPGTLRDALQQGNRFIHFVASGDIVTDRAFVIDKSNITISGWEAPVGQTPGGRVTIRPTIRLCTQAPFSPCTADSQCGAGGKCNSPAGIRITGAARNVVITGIKVRNAVDDGIRVENGAQRVVIDHVSVTDSGDGNVDVVGANTRDVTVSWSILGHNAKSSLISDNATRVTMHHNLFIGGSERNPLASFAALQKCPTGAPNCNGDDFATCPVNEDPAHTIDGGTTLDMVNNIVWNWPVEGTKIRLGAMANVVANVFRTNTGASNSNTSLIVCPERCPIAQVGACKAEETRYPAAAYARLNDNVAIGGAGSIDAAVNTTSPSDRFAAPPVTQKAALQAACDILDRAGARSLTGGWTLDGTDQPLANTVSVSGCS